MAPNTRAIATVIFSAISALIHLNAYAKLSLMQKVTLKKKKSLILAMANVNSTARNAEILSRRRKIPQRRRFWVKPGRSDKWWQNMMDGKCVSDEWKKNFRMPKEQFMELVDELRPYISPSPNSPRPSITAEKGNNGNVFVLVKINW